MLLILSLVLGLALPALGGRLRTAAPAHTKTTAGSHLRGRELVHAL
jgi:hypothetical protein